jgi:universal stress protein A
MLLKRILVPVDFSGRSHAALVFAVGLAREHRAEIDVVHVLPGPSGLAVVVDAYSGRPMPHLSAGERVDASERMASLLASVEHEGVTLHQKIEQGDPAATIVRLASEDGDDLIVLGTHGRVGLVDLIMGSVAKRLLSCAPCPMVTLRDPEVR